LTASPSVKPLNSAPNPRYVLIMNFSVSSAAAGSNSASTPAAKVTTSPRSVSYSPSKPSTVCLRMSSKLRSSNLKAQWKIASLSIAVSTY